MKPIAQSRFVVLALMALILTACADASTPVTKISTPVPTHTMAPTNTSTATPAPSPTITPVPPTATVPAPDKVLEYLNNVEVVSRETFDEQLSSYNWYFDLALITANGVVEFPGKSWWAVLGPSKQFSEGQGVVLDFQYAKGAIFEMYFSRGFTDDSFFKTFCVYFEKNVGRTNVWAAQNSLGGETIPGDLILKPDSNYSLMMVIIPDGEFLTVIWEPSNPSKISYYHEKIGKNWSDLPWGFSIAAKSGAFFVNEYQEITFDSIK